MLASYPVRYFPFQRDKHVSPPASMTTSGCAFQPPGANFVPSEPFSPPSSVLTTTNNKCTADMYQSTTQGTYKPLKYQPPCQFLHDLPQHSIYYTNFKLPTDYRVDNFMTTNRAEYSCKPMDCKALPTASQPVHGQLSLSKCPVIVGSRCKAPFEEKSEYSKSFLNHGAVGRESYLNIAEKLNKDNVKRGIEAHSSSEFSTTMRDTFKSIAKQEKTFLSRSALNEKEGFSSILFGIIHDQLINNTSSGDPEKERSLTSQHQDSYGANTSSEPPSIIYNKKTAHDNVYNSSIRLGDSNCNKPSSISVQYPHPGNPERQLPVNLDHNLSSFPAGDLYPERVRERMSFLHSRTFSKPPPGSFPSYVNMSQLRTRSSVHFGQSLSTHFPESTSLATYKPLAVKVDHVQAPTTDDITHVFAYKSRKPLVSTAHDSYDVKQLAKPSVTRYNLKDSHWKFPNMGVSFTTTHQAHFTPPLV